MKDPIQDLLKKYGEGSIWTPPAINEEIDIMVERIPTPYPSLNRLLGGGIGRRKITELYGAESSGKTSLALAMGAGKKVGFLDAEFNWEPSTYLWAEKMGVSRSDILVLQPSYAEEGMNMIRDICPYVDVIIYDSVASLSTKMEQEDNIEATKVADKARLMSKFFRTSIAGIYKSNTALIFINQLRTDINVHYGNPNTTSGGRALRFYASQRIELGSSKKTDSKGNLVGQNVRVKLIKDKLSGNNGLKTELSFYRHQGFSVEEDVLNCAIEAGVVEQAGAWFKYGGESYQGKPNILKLMVDNPELTSEILQKVEQ